MLKNYFQKRFINWLTKDLFNTITEKDILRQVSVLEAQQKKIKPGLYYMGKKVTEDSELIERLNHNAVAFTESVLWEVLSNEVKYLANIRMFEKGKSGDDILFSKATLYVLEIIDRKLKELSNL